MNTYNIDGLAVDSVDLKCLAVSRGVRVDGAVYRRLGKNNRLDVNPLCCNCFLLSDGTVVQLTDLRFHLRYLSGILSWNNLRLLKYARDLTTPFSLQMRGDDALLLYNKTEIDTVTFPKKSNFYRQKTPSGQPFTGNAVLQGLDWVSFQCLWPCEYAAGGQACQFCFSGADFENAAIKGKPQPPATPATDVADIVAYAAKNDSARHVQLTGGSTHSCQTEAAHITSYLSAINALAPRDGGETLLYITPPDDPLAIDNYFSLGATRIACSLEVWDMTRARTITPGKIDIAGRERYLQALEHTAQKHGPAKAISNFIIGLEDLDTLAEGAQHLAIRGILPAASVWMPMGRPVLGSMKAPSVDYYKRTKDLLADLYTKYNLEPPKSQGLNVCVSRDIWNYAAGGKG